MHNATMDDGTWYRVVIKEIEHETAKSRALELYYEATIKGKNNLPQNTRSFSSIAKSTVKKLEGMRDTSQWKQTYQANIYAVDADTKWAALELMLASSSNVVASAKKMTKPDTKTVTRTISIPKTKIIKQPAQQTSKSAANDAVRTAIKPITPQKPLSNQQSS